MEQLVSSTNTLLRQRAEAGEPEGLALVAAAQTAGRGRRDHTFFSPPDTGLYLSFLVRPQLSAKDALLLTTCAAAAVALAIEDCAGVPAEIKWVNDVFCRGKKVCGILTEGALDLDQDFSLRVREADGTERTLSSGEVRVRPAKDRC